MRLLWAQLLMARARSRKFRSTPMGALWTCAAARTLQTLAMWVPLSCCMWPGPTGVVTSITRRCSACTASPLPHKGSWMTICSAWNLPASAITASLARSLIYIQPRLWLVLACRCLRRVAPSCAIRWRSIPISYAKSMASRRSGRRTLPRRICTRRVGTGQNLVMNCSS